MRDQTGTKNPYFRHGCGSPRKHTPEYTAWTNIRQRCTNPKVRGYENYGGRGITICDNWNDFLNFLRDIGPRPEGVTGKRATYSVERIDVNGNYEPGNVRWATTKEQAANRRKSTSIDRFTNKELVEELQKRGFICLSQQELGSGQN